MPPWKKKKVEEKSEPPPLVLPDVPPVKVDLCPERQILYDKGLSKEAIDVMGGSADGAAVLAPSKTLPLKTAFHFATTQIGMTQGATSISLYHITRYRVQAKSILPEIEIPGREGGKLQYLGSYARALSVEGFWDASGEVGTTTTGVLANLETMRSTDTDITVVQYYVSDTIDSSSWRIEDYEYEPVPGYVMYHWTYTINLKRVT